MVGREIEMEHLVHSLGSALQGHGRCCFISGQLGIGKRYVLNELKTIAEGINFSIREGTCDCNRAPYSDPFSQAFPEIGRMWPSKKDLPISLLNLLGKESSQGPLLLVLEDLHRADKETVSILILISRSITSLPVMIVGTFQTEQLGIFMDDEVSPLIEGLRLLRREGLCDELELKPFDRAQLNRLLEVELEGQIDERMVEELWSKSEGNPMIALEAARLLIQAKQVEQRNGYWQITGFVTIDLPDTYLEIIERRLERLSGQDMRVLETAAVIGERFTPGILAQVQQRPLLDVLEHLDRLARENHLIEERDDAYRFSQRGIQDVLLSRISYPRVKEIHHRVGHILEHEAPYEAKFDDISNHYFSAEVKTKCVCFSILSGQQSMERGEWKKAIVEFQKVIDATEDGGYEEERRFSLEGMANAELQLGNQEAAKKK